METAPTIPNQESTSPGTSIWSRLLNVIAAPGEVFAEVKSSKPSTANWLVPALIYFVVSVISAFVIFSQPTIIQQLRDQQASAMDQQVKAGKITQAQADQAAVVMEKFAGPGMMIAIGSTFAAVGGFVHIFWWAFVLWLMGQLTLKIKFPFRKAVEVAGLATMILVLGAVVTTLLTVILGKLGATPSLVLLVDKIDFQNKTHMLLAAVNVFNLWLVGVSAAGLSALTGAPFAKSLLIVSIYWLVFCLFFIVVGMGQMAM